MYPHNPGHKTSGTSERAAESVSGRSTASRDAFAIEALKGLLSGAGSYTPQEIARLTYRIADAMIDERAK